MKTKARDIIQEWPRGRSTTAKYDNTRWRGWDWYSIWPHRSSEEFDEQMKIEIIYHQMQQAMVNEYFERYRIKPTYSLNHLPFKLEDILYKVRTKDCLYCHWMNTRMMTFDRPYCGRCIHRYA